MPAGNQSQAAPSLCLLCLSVALRFGRCRRGPRPGEVHGKHYYFTDREAMSAQVAAGMFLEHADVHGNM